MQCRLWPKYLGMTGGVHLLGRPAVSSVCPNEALSGPRCVGAKAAPNFTAIKGTRAMTTLQGSAQKQLRQLVEQIERLEEEKKALASDIRDKYLEAKGVGFDVKALRQIVRLRKKSDTERQEEDSILEVYMHALGMLGAAPTEADADRMMAAE